MKFERKVKFFPAYDKRNEGYGIHGVNLRFILIGEKAAMQLLIYTNWQLPHITKENEMKISSQEFPHLLCNPIPADFGYHAKEPQYEDQSSYDCDIFDKCYYDGSGLYAQAVFDRLCMEGDKAVWEELEKAYIERFGDGK